MKNKTLIFGISICSFLIQSCSDLDNEGFIKTTRSMQSGSALQDYYYYYHGKKIAITSVKNLFYISSIDSINLKNLDFKSSAITLKTNLQTPLNKGYKSTFWKIIEIQNSKQETSISNRINAVYSSLLNKNIYIAPVFGSKQNTVATSEYFYIKTKKGKENLLYKYAEQQNVDIIEKVKFVDGWYVLRAPKNSNGLEMSNTFYETGMFEDVDPAFIFNFQPNECTSEPDENNQWALNKINMCEAWSITKGSPSVTVAVLDQGIDQTHREFLHNYSQDSYDLQNQSSPSIVRGKHGTHVGGIIGANHNGYQIAGISPNTTLLSISHDLHVSQTISKDLASGFGYANAKGAAIINNSWGDQGGALYDYLHSSLLENSINTAITSGRNGKGMVVVFAAGNKDLQKVDYPANSNPGILVVGSIDSSNQKSPFSSYGNSLDVMAPGGNILSTIPGNETAYMSGTSMAAPHISGLASLILSVNPTLSGKEVVDIIEKSAKKIPSYSYSSVSNHPNGTWNNETGYGLCDAYIALLMAKSNTTFNNEIVKSDKWIYGLNIQSNNITVSNKAELRYSVGKELTITSPFTITGDSKLSIY